MPLIVERKEIYVKRKFILFSLFIAPPALALLSSTAAAGITPVATISEAAIAHQYDLLLADTIKRYREKNPGAQELLNNPNLRYEFPGDLQVFKYPETSLAFDEVLARAKRIRDKTLTESSCRLPSGEFAVLLHPHLWGSSIESDCVPHWLQLLAKAVTQVAFRASLKAMPNGPEIGQLLNNWLAQNTTHSSVLLPVRVSAPSTLEDAMRALEVRISPSFFACGGEEILDKLNAHASERVESLKTDLRRIGFQSLCLSASAPQWDREDRRTTGFWTLMVLDQSGIAYGFGWDND